MRWSRSAHSNWVGRGVGGVITGTETQQYKNSHQQDLQQNTEQQPNRIADICKSVKR
jgi:hypothetical protein